MVSQWYIFSTQIKDAFGLDIDKVPSDFLAKWELYFTHFDTLNTTALILTVATILISIYSKKITSKVPGSFIAIIGVTLAVQLFDLPVTTIESFFGEIPTTIR